VRRSVNGEAEKARCSHHRKEMPGPGKENEFLSILVFVVVAMPFSPAAFAAAAPTAFVMSLVVTVPAMFLVLPGRVVLAHIAVTPIGDVVVDVEVGGGEALQDDAGGRDRGAPPDISVEEEVKGPAGIEIDLHIREVTINVFGSDTRHGRQRQRHIDAGDWGEGNLEAAAGKGRTPGQEKDQGDGWNQESRRFHHVSSLAKRRNGKGEDSTPSAQPPNRTPLPPSPRTCPWAAPASPVIKDKNVVLFYVFYMIVIFYEALLRTGSNRNVLNFQTIFEE
jgi:hypothetical protein